MSSNNLVCYEQEIVARLRVGLPCRATKELDNGNLAIIQIADPNAVPFYTKWLRDRKGKLAKIARSLEAAVRVGWIVYKNSMRKGDKPPTKRRRKKCTK